jgi:hypothetical protein
MHIEYWKKNISILAKATQVSDVAHGPLVFYSTTVFKKFHDKIKVVFYVRSSIQRIQYWECKQRLGNVNVYNISKNGRTP